MGQPGIVVPRGMALKSEYNLLVSSTTRLMID
jgi:hypothetical protein